MTENELRESKKKMPKYYYLDGTVSDRFIGSKVLHRKNGPAIVGADYIYAWYYYGVLHCLSGPAYHRIDLKEYWIDGRSYSETEWKNIVEKIKNMSILEKLTSSEKWIRELGKEEKDDNMRGYF